MVDDNECPLDNSDDDVDFTNLHFTIEVYHVLLSDSSKLSEAFQLTRNQNKKI